MNARDQERLKRAILTGGPGARGLAAEDFPRIAGITMEDYFERERRRDELEQYRPFSLEGRLEARHESGPAYSLVIHLDHATTPRQCDDILALLEEAKADVLRRKERGPEYQPFTQHLLRQHGYDGPMELN